MAGMEDAGYSGEDGWRQGWKFRMNLHGMCGFLRKKNFVLENGIHPLHLSCLHGTQLSPSLDPSVPCSHLKSGLSHLSRRELCTADWPQCSRDHHQARGGMSVSVCMPGLCQGAGGWQEKGLFFPTPSRAEPPASRWARREGTTADFSPTLCSPVIIICHTLFL